MNELSDEQCIKIAEYITKNAETLVNNDCVSWRREYPDREHLRAYKRLVIEIPNLGIIESYQTFVSDLVELYQNQIRFFFTEEQIYSSSIRPAIGKAARIYREKVVKQAEENRNRFFNL